MRTFYFRPRPFYGLVVTQVDRKGFWHNVGTVRHYQLASLAYSRYQKFWEVALIVGWLRISFCRQNCEH